MVGVKRGVRGKRKGVEKIRELRGKNAERGEKAREVRWKRRELRQIKGNDK